MKNDIFLNTLTRYNLLFKGARIIAGVSGGADSMCMLHMLLSVKDKYGLDITVAHVNHMLRNEEADRDENFVRDYCNNNNIKFNLQKADVKKIAKENGLGCEECGRNIRYEFFASLAGDDGLIATAHTASDNVETVIFNIARGCGLKGLSGIPVKRGNIIRPLIGMTRAQVEEYCKTYSVPYITDSSNSSDLYSRNIIRHKVIPVLKSINSNVENNVQNMCALACEDDNYLYCLAQKELEKARLKNGYSAKIISNLPISLKKRSIIIMAQNTGASPDKRQLDIITSLLNDGGCLDIDKKVRFISKNGVCYFDLVKKVKNHDKTPPIPFVSLLSTEKTNKKYEVFLLENDELLQKNKNNKLLFNNSIDCAIISDNTLLRTRLPGDFFKQYGRGCTKSLKKLFNELKLTKEQKDEVVLLANGNEVIWIDGIGVSENAAVSFDTKKIAYIKTKENCYVK